MSNTKLVVALLGGLALPLAAVAADPADYQSSPTGQQSAGGDATPRGAQGRSGEAALSSMFQELDTNHDGYIDAKEVAKSATANAKFKNLDKNHDGKISIDEWKTGGMD